MHRIKFHFNQTYFAFCAKTHIRAPDAGSRGHNTVSISFFQESVRILPHQTKEKITGKKLAVVGMSAKDQICTGICEQGEFFWLMVYDQDRFGMIEMFGKLLWSHALSFLSLIHISEPTRH